MSAFTKARDAVIAFLTGPLWDFIHPFIVAIEVEGAHLLLTAAENAVTAGFNVAGDSREKMDAALNSFKSEVTSNGHTFIESQARTLIELALQKAKAVA
ncbi:hypothetical protein P12x_005239 [Tundrisphaera lichenicola]|uniref:hypothetical protein n=1 Tax=Tundrisphaera lichenicola TaxID=2029860 RepID=UPI003EBC6482